MLKLSYSINPSRKQQNKTKTNFLKKQMKPKKKSTKYQCTSEACIWLLDDSLCRNCLTFQILWAMEKAQWGVFQSNARQQSWLTRLLQLHLVKFSLALSTWMHKPSWSNHSIISSNTYPVLQTRASNQTKTGRGKKQKTCLKIRAVTSQNDCTVNSLLTFTNFAGGGRPMPRCIKIQIRKVRGLIHCLLLPSFQIRFLLLVGNLQHVFSEHFTGGPALQGGASGFGLQVGGRHPALLGRAGLGGTGLHQPAVSTLHVHHLHDLTLCQLDWLCCCFSIYLGRAVVRDHQVVCMFLEKTHV